MAHVITQPCCNDASCIDVCPVNCIHPTPDEPDFISAEMLYIDPDTCIDCGACVDECPVEAIFPDDSIDEGQERYLQINADYYTDHDVSCGLVASRKEESLPPGKELHVAIVGAGPAAFYAAEELLKHSAIRVDMFDRLPTPYGLVRAGVAPDHPSTKGVEKTFASTAAKATFEYFLHVEMGKHLNHDELTDHYGAVVYAHGASSDKQLGVDGEDLPGSIAATAFVAWYNGHPDYADRDFDLSAERAVVVGNGNVALDVARILLDDPDHLAKTDIADHALEKLRTSNIKGGVAGPARYRSGRVHECRVLGDGRHGRSRCDHRSPGANSGFGQQRGPGRRDVRFDDRHEGADRRRVRRAGTDRRQQAGRVPVPNFPGSDQRICQRHRDDSVCTE